MAEITPTILFGDPRLPARYWKKVRRDGEHWLWTGSTYQKGYGSVHHSGGRKAQRKIGAHIWMCEVAHGPKPSQNA